MRDPARQTPDGLHLLCRSQELLQPLALLAGAMQLGHIEQCALDPGHLSVAREDLSGVDQRGHDLSVLATKTVLLVDDGALVVDEPPKRMRRSGDIQETEAQQLGPRVPEEVEPRHGLRR